MSKHKKLIIHGFDETINKILKTNASISRFGDGEFNIIAKSNNIGFQEITPELSNRLLEILNSNTPNLLICINEFIFNDDLNALSELAFNYYKRYSERNREDLLALLDPSKEYYSSGITRPYIDYKNKSNCKHKFDSLKRLWFNKKIVIVEGEQSRLGIGNDLFSEAISIERILCPAENAFSKYDLILNAVLKEKKDKLIIISLGPTATVLAHDLSLLGYQALDVGHVDIEYFWFLMNVTEKVSIPGKYINEIGQKSVGDIYDPSYLKQIKQRIL